MLLSKQEYEQIDAALGAELNVPRQSEWELYSQVLKVPNCVSTGSSGLTTDWQNRRDRKHFQKIWLDNIRKNFSKLKEMESVKDGIFSLVYHANNRDLNKYNLECSVDFLRFTKDDFSGLRRRESLSQLAVMYQTLGWNWLDKPVTIEALDSTVTTMLPMDYLSSGGLTWSAKDNLLKFSALEAVVVGLPVQQKPPVPLDF